MTVPVRARRCVFVVLMVLSACSGYNASSSSVEPDERTPLAIFEAQEELYRAVWEDPPNLELAVSRVAAKCQGDTDEETLTNVLEEVQLAKDVEIDQEELFSAFSQISYDIAEDEAIGSDGSRWLYENRRWRLVDCST